MSYSIFEYKEFAACNFLGGNTNSFEVRILEKGEIEYRKANFNNKTLEYTIYELSQATVAKIKETIEKNNKIFEVNSKLNNGTLDGNGNEFWFADEKRNRQILAWNIQASMSNNNGSENDEEETSFKKENKIQERIVLKLFFEICDILKQDGFELDLYKFETENHGRKIV